MFSLGLDKTRVGSLPMELEVEITKTAIGGSLVIFKTTLRNLSIKSITLGLAKPFFPDVVVFNGYGKPVWNCLNGSPIRTIDAPYTIKALEKKTFICAWAGIQNNGQKSLLDNYTAESWLYTSDPSVNFTYKSLSRKFSYP